MGKLISFPPVMRHVKCPRCNHYCTGIFVEQTPLGPRKFLVPCHHEIAPEQEAKIVNDMYKRGL